jgi:sensor histidine kinase regulating citrate/malate metabolism
MKTQNLTNNVLAYSGGFAISAAIAGITKTTIDSVVKNKSVQVGTTVLALVILVAGTMAFSKMIKPQLVKADKEEPKAE